MCVPYSVNLIRLYGTPIERHLSGLYVCFINIAAKLRDRGSPAEFRAEILEIAIECYIASKLLPLDESRDLRIGEALAAAEEALRFLDAHPKVIERILPANGRGVFSADPEIDRALQKPYAKLRVQFQYRLKRITDALRLNESSNCSSEDDARLFEEYRHLIQAHEVELRAFLRKYVLALPEEGGIQKAV